MARETESHEEPQDAGGATASSSTRRVVSVIALVLGLAAGGGVGWTLIGPALAAHKGAGGGEEGGGHGSEKEGGSLYTIENLVVNPAESRGMRFLVVSLAIEMSDAEAAEELTARDAELRDALVKLLGAKTVQELSNVHLRDSLKHEIRATVSGVAPEGEVRQVYLPLFVIQ